MPADIAHQLEQAVTHFSGDLETIRTGRANPALVEQIPVSCYGVLTPLQQLAAINVPEPQLIVIQPWDPSIVKDIDKAIQQSGLGVTPVVDGKILRLPFPPMTEERRRELLKIVNEKAEATRVRIRGHREDAMKELRLQEKDGRISEDALAAEQKSIQSLVDDAIASVESTVGAKTNELMTI